MDWLMEAFDYFYGEALDARCLWGTGTREHGLWGFMRDARWDESRCHSPNGPAEGWYRSHEDIAHFRDGFLHNLTPLFPARIRRRSDPIGITDRNRPYLVRSGWQFETEWYESGWLCCCPGTMSLPEEVEVLLKLRRD